MNCHKQRSNHHIQEECGVFGIYSPTRQDVAGLTYYGLYALQHRGQEAAGIAVNDDGVFSIYKDTGLVGDVFNSQRISDLGKGSIAVGHVRYSTTGSDSIRNVQPLVVNHRKGVIALAHNGNLVNAFDLRASLENKGSIFHTSTDTEVIAYVIVQERLKCGSIEESVSAAMEYIEGAYSLVISSPTKLIAARDPHGFRPLCMGRRPDNSIVFASETCALDAVGAVFVRDIEPGEVVTISQDGVKSDTRHCNKTKKSLCVFEYIYFSRPDSKVDGTWVSEARQQAGAYLAQEHAVDADVVIGVPDSGLEAAIGFARESGIPYATGFAKNKYIGRTFISSTQSQREAGVNIKLNPIKAAIEGKRVVVIDDSIVRGTTCRHTIDLLRAAGATEVHMRVSSPPFIAPCFYGVDVDSPENLIANQHSIDEIAKIIGADSLGYLSIDHACRIAGPKNQDSVCCGCFNGIYPTSIPTGDKNRFEQPIHR